jgi:hypothetical protein
MRHDDVDLGGCHAKSHDRVLTPHRYLSNMYPRFPLRGDSDLGSDQVQCGVAA